MAFRVMLSCLRGTEPFIFFDRANGVIIKTIPKEEFFTPTTLFRDLDNKPVIATEALILVASYTSGVVSAWSSATLNKLWMTHLDRGSVMELVVDEKYVYSVYAGGQMGVMRLSDGGVEWQLDRGDLRSDHEEGVLYSPALDGEHI